MRDTKSGSKAELSINPLLLTAAGVGDQGVDLDGCQGALCVVTAGVIATGSYSVVAAADLIGAAMVFGPSSDNTAQIQGYRGGKRFIRIDLETVTGTSGTGGLFTGIVIKSLPPYSPQV
jgi:hypothetical protein